MEYRIEHDSLGEMKVPRDAYYGAQTARAMRNFTVTGIPVSHYRHHIEALACIKEAAAEANHALGLLDGSIKQGIVSACREIRHGALHEQFTVDVIQGGAGTSVNMNANEVIANRALEIMGHKRGEYDKCHPNNHVNLSQSTNDVYPTSLRLAVIIYGREFASTLRRLSVMFGDKGREFKDILKMGRTQLQDAVPMTLGQEFTAFGVTVGEEVERIKEGLSLLREINMGATAIGTGINTVPGYSQLVCERLASITGIDLTPAGDLVEATSDTGVFVQISGLFKRVAVKVSKICNDLRLLSSGPYAGFNEINLPPMQPGSSIMPGKVNPVIPEMVNQICYQAIGNDLTVTMAVEAGQLQLNVFLPIMAFNLFQTMDMLDKACKVFMERCLSDITANPERCLELVKNSNALVTALVPCLGYEQAAKLAEEALSTRRSVRELVLEKGILTEAELDDLLDPQKMTCPRAR